MKDLLLKISMPDTAKLLSIGWVPMLLNYVGLNTDMVVLLSALLCFDITTGILKSFRTKRFSSNISGIWISKKLGIMLLLITVAILWKIAYLNNIFIKSEEWLSVVLNYIVLAFACVEFFSIFQNIYVIYSKKEVKELDAFLIVIEAWYSILSKALYAVIDYAKKTANTFIKEKLK